MRRKAHNRLWTFVFTLLLCVASMASMPRNVRADQLPGEPPPTSTPPPGAGDPDWPAGVGRTPKPGEAIPITARRVVTVHASQKLKAIVEDEAPDEVANERAAA